MEVRSLSTDVAAAVGSPVRLQGWLHRRRSLKAVTFLVLRDRAGLVQVVAPPEAVTADGTPLAAVPEESVLEVTGTAVANPAAPGGVEVTAPSVRVLSCAAAPLPLELHRPELTAGLPVQLDHAAVALRHPRRRAVARLAAASVGAFRDVLREQGFTEVHTPKVVASATESGANVFELDWFGRKAFLAQSPQFYKQTLVGVHERVMEVGPVFRAEPHDTARHLASYVSLDAELGFIDGHLDVLAVLLDVVRGMVSAVQADPGAVELAGVALPVVPAGPGIGGVPVVHFAEALEMVSSAFGEDLSGEPDLAPVHERWLGEWALREHGSDLVAVTGYPMVKRPFYTHPQEGDPRWSASFDLLFRGLELVTGGQRLHRYDDYVAALAARGEGTAAYEGYLEAFRHGMPPHGGFAIGLERWMARLTGAANVREVTAFPRDLHRLTP